MSNRVVLLLLALGTGCAHSVTFHSNPEGAKVLLDGKEAGVTPLTIEDNGSLGGNTHSLELTMPEHKPVILALDQSLRPIAVVEAGLVGGAAASAMLVTALALTNTAPGPAAGLCLLSPLGLLAGCPIGAHAWQLPQNDFVVADFVEQDREKARMLAAQEAAEKAEAHVQQLCAADNMGRSNAAGIYCGDRAMKAADKPGALVFWKEALTKATEPDQVCEASRRIRSVSLHPEEDLQGASKMVVDGCIEAEKKAANETLARKHCLIQCQSAYDTCLNTPVQRHLLYTHTLGCEENKRTCDVACKH